MSRKHSDLRADLTSLAAQRSAQNTAWVGRYRALMLQVEQVSKNADAVNLASKCRRLAAEFVSTLSPSGRANLFLQLRDIESLLFNALDANQPSS